MTPPCLFDLLAHGIALVFGYPATATQANYIFARGMVHAALAQLALAFWLYRFARDV